MTMDKFVGDIFVKWEFATSKRIRTIYKRRLCWGRGVLGPERRVMSGERRTGTQGSNRAKILVSMYSDRWSSGMVGNLDRRG